MNIRQWFETYNGILVDPHTSLNAIRDFQAVLEGRVAVLYGAGLLGRRIQEVFQQLGITSTFVDRDAARIHAETGMDVKEPSFLEGIRNADGFVLFAAVNRLTVKSVREDLSRLSTPFVGIETGYDLHVTLQSALCTLKHHRQERLDLQHCYECSILDNTCPVLAKYLQSLTGFEPTAAQGTPNVKMIGYVLGSVCSLNCAHCCESIPYLRPSDKTVVPSKQVMEDISKFARACQFITLLEFIGGEPFLHPGLVQILNEALKIANIGVIHVFTNGTVLPRPELCQVLANPRIVVYISNYTKLLSDKQASKVAKTEQTLRDAAVSFAYGSNANWYDLRSFERVADDEPRLRERYAGCFLHNCNRLHKGSLYRCPHHYGGVMLEKLTPKDDIVRIHDYTDTALAERLDTFIGAEFIDACMYCPMPNAPFVAPGTQV